MAAKENLRKAAGAALTIVGIGLGAWTACILVDLLTFIWAFCFVDNVMESYRISMYLGKIIALAFAVLASFLVNKILFNLIKRNKNWVWMLSGCMLSWYLVMYIISAPYTSGLFNPFDGRSRANYERLPNGAIKVFPKSIQNDPDTGKALQELDPKTAEEYQKQSSAKKPNYFWDSLFPKPTQIYSLRDEDNLALWVEKIQIAPDRTVVYLACKGKDEEKEGWLLADGPSSTYLVDNSGQVYNLTSSTATYNQDIVYETHFFSKDDLAAAHYVRIGETYRYILTFPALQPGTSEPTLHHGWFDKALDLSEVWANAENISALPPPPPPTPAEPPAQPVQTSTVEETPIETADQTPPPAPPVQVASAPPIPPTQAKPQATPEPAVPCPPDPPPPKPGQLSLPSVAFRTIPANCVPVAQPQIPTMVPAVSGQSATLDSNPSSSDWMTSEDSERFIEIHVDHIRIMNNQTVLFLSARTKYKASEIDIHEISDGNETFLEDTGGRTYRYREIIAGQIVSTSSYSHQYRQATTPSDILRIGELFYFTITFEPITRDAGGLTLHLNGYHPMRIL